MRHFYLLLFSVVISTGLSAETPSSTPITEVKGAWQLTGYSLREDAEIAEEQGEWNFKEDGTVVITSYYKFSKRKGTVSASYRVEDGALVVQMGANSTPRKYEIIEKSDRSLLLKGVSSGSAGYYHFSR